MSGLHETFWHWGTTQAERDAPWPCDDRAREGEVSLFRAIDIGAPPERVFRWLCQLRVAPYSYDWIDNLGRRSPTEWTLGAGDLAPGQTFMVMFRLLDYEMGRWLQLQTKESKLVGQVLVTYQALPVEDVEPSEQELAGPGTRLIARLRCIFPKNPLGAALRGLLPAGDWVMMRKQFLTLKALSERDARRAHERR